MANIKINTNKQGGVRMTFQDQIEKANKIIIDRGNL